jgi:uncharacterized hydrophobic protein (TIGR00271 family)
MSLRRLDIMVQQGDVAERVLSTLVKELTPEHARFIVSHPCLNTHPPMEMFQVTLYPDQVGHCMHALAGAEVAMMQVQTVQAAKPLPPHPALGNEVSDSEEEDDDDDNNETDAAALTPEETAAKVKRKATRRKKRKKSLHLKLAGWLSHYGSKRMSIEEIHNVILDGNSISFDFLIMLIGASIIAGLGLAVNSDVMVVASMLVSPLMGPILAFTFGAAVHDKKMMKSGCKNETFAFLLTMLIGFILGLCLTPFAQRLRWPTDEMSARGDTTNLLVGVIFAVASGMVVGVAVTGGGVNSLVGVAISASLLPPVVNIGMQFAFALLGPVIYETTATSNMTIGSGRCTLIDSMEQCGLGQYDQDAAKYIKVVEGKGGVHEWQQLFAELGQSWEYTMDPIQAINTAGISFLLFMMNFVVIFFVTWFMFEIKQIRGAGLLNQDGFMGTVKLRDKIKIKNDVLTALATNDPAIMATHGSQAKWKRAKRAHRESVRKSKSVAQEIKAKSNQVVPMGAVPEENSEDAEKIAAAEKVLAESKQTHERGMSVDDMEKEINAAA